MAAILRGVDCHRQLLRFSVFRWQAFRRYGGQDPATRFHYHESRGGLPLIRRWRAWLPEGRVQIVLPDAGEAVDVGFTKSAKVPTAVSKVAMYHRHLMCAHIIAAFVGPRGMSREPTSGDVMRIPAVGAPAGTVKS